MIMLQVSPHNLILNGGQGSFTFEVTSRSALPSCTGPIRPLFVEPVATKHQHSVPSISAQFHHWNEINNLIFNFDFS